MLRVLQMAIANLIVRREGANPGNIVPLFMDNSDMIFSIQTITQLSATMFPHKKPCEWYSPSEAAFLMQSVLQKFNLTYRVAVCNDGSIFLNEIPTDKESIVVLVTAMIGLDKPEPQYLQTLVDFMESRFFFAILGGTPRYAHLFLKHKDGFLGYLDPHQTKKAAEFEEEILLRVKEYSGKLQWIRKQKISSSMCLMFVMHRKEVSQFWQELHKIREKNGEGFFLYLKDERPVFSTEGII